jgi:hypothetical protein
MDMCHHGHTITVGESAVAPHLAQDDTMGGCALVGPNGKGR